MSNLQKLTFASTFFSLLTLATFQAALEIPPPENFTRTSVDSAAQIRFIWNTRSESTHDGFTLITERIRPNPEVLGEKIINARQRAYNLTDTLPEGYYKFWLVATLNDGRSNRSRPVNDTVDYEAEVYYDRFWVSNPSTVEYKDPTPTIGGHFSVNLYGKFDPTIMGSNLYDVDVIIELLNGRVEETIKLEASKFEFSNVRYRLKQDLKIFRVDNKPLRPGCEYNLFIRYFARHVTMMNKRGRHFRLRHPRTKTTTPDKPLNRTHFVNFQTGQLVLKWMVNPLGCQQKFLFRLCSNGNSAYCLPFEVINGNKREHRIPLLPSGNYNWSLVSQVDDILFVYSRNSTNQIINFTLDHEEKIIAVENFFEIFHLDAWYQNYTRHYDGYIYLNMSFKLNIKTAGRELHDMEVLIIREEDETNTSIQVAEAQYNTSHFYFNSYFMLQPENRILALKKNTARPGFKYYLHFTFYAVHALRSSRGKYIEFVSDVEIILPLSKPVNFTLDYPPGSLYLNFTWGINPASRHAYFELSRCSPYLSCDDPQRLNKEKRQTRLYVPREGSYRYTLAAKREHVSSEWASVQVTLDHTTEIENKSNFFRKFQFIPSYKSNHSEYGGFINIELKFKLFHKFTAGDLHSAELNITEYPYVGFITKVKSFTFNSSDFEGQVNYILKEENQPIKLEAEPNPGYFYNFSFKFFAMHPYSGRGKRISFKSHQTLIVPPLRPYNFSIISTEESLEKHFVWDSDSESLHDRYILKICPRNNLNNSERCLDDIVINKRLRTYPMPSLFGGKYSCYLLSQRRNVNSVWSDVLDFDIRHECPRPKYFEGDLQPIGNESLSKFESGKDYEVSCQASFFSYGDLSSADNWSCFNGSWIKGASCAATPKLEAFAAVIGLSSAFVITVVTFFIVIGRSIKRKRLIRDMNHPVDNEKDQYLLAAYMSIQAERQAKPLSQSRQAMSSPFKNYYA